MATLTDLPTDVLRLVLEHLDLTGHRAVFACRSRALREAAAHPFAWPVGLCISDAGVALGVLRFTRGLQGLQCPALGHDSGADGARLLERLAEMSRGFLRRLSARPWDAGGDPRYATIDDTSGVLLPRRVVELCPRLTDVHLWVPGDATALCDSAASVARLVDLHVADLDVGACGNGDGVADGMRALFAALPQSLRVLRLSDARHGWSSGTARSVCIEYLGGISDLAAVGPDVEELALLQLDQDPADEHWEEYAPRAGRLRRLELGLVGMSSYTPPLGNRGVAALAAHCVFLEELRVVRGMFTSQGLGPLLRSAGPTLRVLDVGLHVDGWEHVRGAALSRTCPNLRELRIEHCHDPFGLLEYVPPPAGAVAELGLLVGLSVLRLSLPGNGQYGAAAMTEAVRRMPDLADLSCDVGDASLLDAIATRPRAGHVRKLIVRAVTGDIPLVCAERFVAACPNVREVRFGRYWTFTVPVAAELAARANEPWPSLFD